MGHKFYVGHRETNETIVEVIDKNARSRLPWRLDVWNHSPTGFEWGYAGSGPAQLSLAILCDLLPAPQAVFFHQRFKFEVIALLNKNYWELDEETVWRWLARHLVKECADHLGIPTEVEQC